MDISKKVITKNLLIFVLLILLSIGVSAAAEDKIVTLADDGQTITLQVNETFLLKLGEEYDWNITIDDQTIVSRDVVSGAQGLYRAHKEGSSTLTAVGDPECRKVQPPCGAPSRVFRINIVVGAPKTSGFGVFLAIMALMVAFVRRR